MLKWLKKLFNKEERIPLLKYKLTTDTPVEHIEKRLEEIKKKTSYTDLEVPNNIGNYNDYYIIPPDINSDDSYIRYFNRIEKLYKYVISQELTISIDDTNDYKKQEIILYSSTKLDHNEFRRMIGEYYNNEKFDIDSFLKNNPTFCRLPIDENKILVTINHIIMS